MKVQVMVLALLALCSCAEFGYAEGPRRSETDHLIIEWRDGAVTEEIDAAKLEGEKHYAAIRELLGHEPANKVTIILQGPAEQPDGSRGYPRVDSKGRIHLYRFGPTHHSYFSALAHEMVHVFRFQRRIFADWFFEEGFAEFIALRVNSSFQGFPWYGFPVLVVAGQWIANGEDIPLSLLREKHRSLNQVCKAQSYALRASFFDHLGKSHGDEAVLEMAGQKLAGALADYESFFGENFDVLEAEWRETLLKDYHGTADIESLARRYRVESPIQYMSVCAEGAEF